MDCGKPSIAAAVNIGFAGDEARGGRNQMRMRRWRSQWHCQATRAKNPGVRLTVRALSAGAVKGFVEIGPYRVPCALGRSGVSARKREGDGATPRGVWRICAVYYDPTRAARPRTRLPVRVAGDCDGWCDAPSDRNYNRPVMLPYPASAERLRRDDGVYDQIVVIDYNMRPRARGKGSAIFLHVARPGLTPTEGCIAVSRQHLRRVLEILGPGAAIIIRI